MWLWEAQNAFLTETNPQTGVKWKDRYGVVRDRREQRFTNVESYLNYGKLHRTGRLLRGLKVKRTVEGANVLITLYNEVPYTAVHEMGGYERAKVKKKGRNVRGVSSVLLGGKIQARPFMRPSKQVRRAPSTFLQRKLKSFKW